MDKETAKAINNISKRLNEVDRKLDRYFNNRIDNAENNFAENTERLYTEGEYRMYNNKLYICLHDNTGIEPTNTTYWKETNVAEELNKLNKLIKGE